MGRGTDLEVIVKADLKEAKQPEVHNEDRTGVGDGGGQITLFRL